MDLASQGSGIITLDIGDADAGRVWKNLMAERIVTAPRGGGIRFSPHIHNDETQIDRALEGLSRAVSEGEL
jgi:hypothetical protein